jgi:cell division protein FtsB
MMRLTRLFLSLYVGIALHFLFTFIFSGAGLGEFHSVLSYREVLRQNLVELENINTSLKQEFRSLGTDPERIRLLARKLNYFEPDENVVRIEGLKERRNYYKIGKLLKTKYRATENPIFFRIVNLIVPLFVYIFTGFLWRSSRDH